jgi:hypothetical protein
MRERQNRNKSDSSGNLDPERDLGDLKESLQAYRDSVCAASERPDHYWKRRHAEILQALNRPESVRRYRTALAWAPAALMVMLCLFFFAENSKAPPKPDLAAGSDEILLINVERALNQDYPDALAPAAFIIEERTGSLKSK